MNKVLLLEQHTKANVLPRGVPQIYRQAENPDMSDKRYLIVIADDDLDDQFIIQEAIKETGISNQVVLLKNGLELMDLLLHKGSFTGSTLPKPDLVIMDLNMPLLDG